jgi:hypothetical protein
MDHIQFPLAARHRMHLVDHAQPISPTCRSHAIKISMRVDGEAAAGTRSVIPAGKCVDHRLRPASARLRQLKSYAAPTFARSRASGDCCAIKISLRVKRHAFVRLAPIRAAGKAVQNRMCPAAARRRKLENRSAAEVSALYRCAVKIARAVDHEIRVQILAVIATGEAVDNLSGTRGRLRWTRNEYQHGRE